MWYPNKTQWWIIWLTVPLALFVWADAGMGDEENERYALALLVIAALLVWRFSRRGGQN
jgi:hypothetical protein